MVACGREQVERTSVFHSQEMFVHVEAGHIRFGKAFDEVFPCIERGGVMLASRQVFRVDDALARRDESQQSDVIFVQDTFYFFH